MKSNKKVIYIAIVIFCSVLDMMFHAATSKISPFPTDGELSFLVKTLGTPLTAFLWILTAYSTVAYIFYKFEDKFSGTGIRKGLRFGSAVALLWIMGMYESISTLGTSFLHETVMGLSDAVPVLLMGFLLGKFTASKNSTIISKKNFNRSNILLTILVFTVTYSVGRSLFYFTEIIDSGYSTRTSATFIWTFLMGTCIGIIYLLMKEAILSSSSLLSTVKFGMILFGVNWFVFLIFIPIMFEGKLVDIITRSILDILLVILSAFISQLIFKNNTYKFKEDSYMK